MGFLPPIDAERSGFYWIGFTNSVIGLVSNAILGDEPRIALNNVTASESELADGLLLIAIEFAIRSTNSSYIVVYPFYRKEAAPRV
jgi:uncharacterized protein